MKKQTKVQCADLLRASALLIEQLNSTLSEYTDLQVRSVKVGTESRSDVEAALWMRGCLTDLSVTVEAMLRYAVPREEPVTAFRLDRDHRQLITAVQVTDVAVRSA